MKLPFVNKIQLQPVQIDDANDELMQAILQEQTVRDNKWVLTNTFEEGAANLWQELESEPVSTSSSKKGE